MRIRDFQKHLKNVLLTPNFWTVVDVHLGNMNLNSACNISDSPIFASMCLTVCVCMWTRGKSRAIRPKALIFLLLISMKEWRAQLAYVHRTFSHLVHSIRKERKAHNTCQKSNYWLNYVTDCYFLWCSCSGSQLVLICKINKNDLNIKHWNLLIINSIDPSMYKIT